MLLLWNSSSLFFHEIFHNGFSEVFDKYTKVENIRKDLLLSPEKVVKAISKIALVLSGALRITKEAFFDNCNQSVEMLIESGGAGKIKT